MSTAIKRERIKTGLTQEEAASKLGIHPTTLNKYEGGSRTPSGKVLSAMSQLFGVRMDTLMNSNAHEQDVQIQGEELLFQKMYMQELKENKELQSRIIQLLDENISLREGSLKKQTSLKKKLA